MKDTYILLTLLISILCSLFMINSSASNDQYLDYLKKFNKEVPPTAERLYRQKIFQDYVEKMQKHNSDPSNGWKMGINQFSDLTQKEFLNTYLGELGSNVPQIED